MLAAELEGGGWQEICLANARNGLNLFAKPLLAAMLAFGGQNIINH